MASLTAAPLPLLTRSQAAAQAGHRGGCLEQALDEECAGARLGVSQCVTRAGTLMLAAFRCRLSIQAAKLLLGVTSGSVIHSAIFSAVRSAIFRHSAIAIPCSYAVVLFASF